MKTNEGESAFINFASVAWLVSLSDKSLRSRTRVEEAEAETRQNPTGDHADVGSQFRYRLAIITMQLFHVAGGKIAGRSSIGGSENVRFSSRELRRA